jgi:hypothetical protein
VARHRQLWQASIIPTVGLTQGFHRFGLSLKELSVSATARKEVSDWLEELGMSEYAQRFAENGISVAALPHVTDQDLKDVASCWGIGE